MKPHVAEVSTNWRDTSRFDSSVPIHLDHGVVGQTLNVSPTGIYFDTDASLRPGQAFPFSLEFADPVGRLWFRAVGKVVRVEDHEGHHGVAAQIVQSRLARD